MLYDKDYNYANNALKDSIISLNKNEENIIQNIKDDDDDIEEIEIENEKIIVNNNNDNKIKEELVKNSDKNNNLKEKQKINEANKDVEYNELLIDDNDKNNIEKNDLMNYIDRDKNNKKSHKISRIEKILKKNILEKENDQDKSQIYQKSSNNYITKYETKNQFYEISQNKIFKNVFAKTPNRLIKSNNTINNNNNDIININDNKRTYTPNITHTNQNEINNNKIEYLDSNDYDNILKTQLKDMENQIDLLNKINISEVKANYFNKINPNNNDVNKFGKTETNHFYNKSEKENQDELRKDFNKGLYLNKTTYNKFYSKINNNIRNHNTINYNENQLQNNIFNEEQNNNQEKKKKNEFNTPPSDKINHNLFQNSHYILNDLKSNNTIDINQRLDNLEKNIIEIRQELNSVSQIVTNFTSKNFVYNFKEDIKIIVDEYMNERNFNNKNYNDDNRSLYSELITEENKQKNIDNEINKKINKKLKNLSEEIRNDIFNKYLKPSLNQIEININRNINEIKDKIDDMFQKGSFKNYNYNKGDINDINVNKQYEYKSNKFSGKQTNNDIFNNNSSNLRNEKYEEINRLGEKLYQKLLEKEKKLKLLKKETSKFLED